MFLGDAQRIDRRFAGPRSFQQPRRQPLRGLDHFFLREVHAVVLRVS